MPYYSDELIEEVRSRNDIVDVIGSYVRLKKKGSTYFGLCPFHNEKTGSFSVSPNKQMYYCFGCGAGGNVFTFLMQYENFTFGEAMQSLADRVGIELPQQEMTSAQRREADRRTRLLEINKEAAKYFYTLLRSPRGQKAYQYFKKRELSDETMQKFGLGYSDQYSDDLYRYLRKKGYDDDILKDSGLITIDEVRGGHDKFWNRAMFPIMDVHNRVIGFGGRVMGDGEPKYLNSPETRIFDKSRNLYGLNIARTTRKNQLLLCEGYMDVIALHQAGFDNAVASLGTALTSGHANLLKRYTNRRDAVTYGIGHGGIEAILVLGLTAINNIAIAQLVNSGSIETITNGLTGAQLDQVQAQIAAVASFGAANLLLGLAERAIAMTLHISLSVVVFRAVRQRKAGYLGLAVALHALFDVPAALFQCGVLHSTWLVEALLLVLCLGCAAYAKKQYCALQEPEQQTLSDKEER